MRRPGIFGGIVLILVGLLFLAGNLGILPPLSWALVGPLIVVALGLWIIISALAPRRTLPDEVFAVPLDGARTARVVLRHGAGRLAVTAGAEPGVLVEGTARGGVTRRETPSNGTVTVELSPPDWVRWPDGGLEWSLRLTEQVPLALQLYVGASENRVDLERVPVREFDLETGASDTWVRLPGRGDCSVSVHGGAASVRLEVPANVAGRIVVRGALTSVNIAPRFQRSGDAWESPGYATAADRVEINAELGVGELRVF